MLRTDQAADSAILQSRYYLACRLSAASLLGFAAIVLLLPLLFGAGVTEMLSLRLALKQDLPLVPVLLVANFLARSVQQGPSGTSFRNSATLVVLGVGGILLFGWLGSQLVFKGYALSRDEQMAVFDQGIYSHGRLFWPIPTQWRPVADALNRRFMLPIGDREFWASAYLPMHAAFRALFASFATPALASPVMGAVGAICIWGLGRRLWPQSMHSTIVPLLFFITSSQVVITSMTAFSMSMHAALNLFWLWLFLTDRRESHVVAVLVGFVATGIHQPLFHPLFALPFFLLLAERRHWKLLGFYLAAYAAISAFWLAWPLWIASHGTGVAAPINCGNKNCMAGVGFVARLFATVTSVSVKSIWLTAANLLRFICWQHPLLLPFAFVGAIVSWRSEPLVRALAISLVLPVVVFAIILPWQGYGWGYRYLHPVIGNGVLLAGFGCNRLEQAGLSLRRPIFLTTALALVLLPIHALMAARVASPFAQVRNQLSSIPADVVIVDADSVPFGQDVVVNSFDLSNRPKLLISSLLKPADLPGLCKRNLLAFYDAPRMAPIAELFGTAPPTRPSAHSQILHQTAARLGCHTVSNAAI